MFRCLRVGLQAVRCRCRRAFILSSPFLSKPCCRIVRHRGPHRNSLGSPLFCCQSPRGGQARLHRRRDCRAQGGALSVIDDFTPSPPNELPRPLPFSLLIFEMLRLCIDLLLLPSCCSTCSTCSVAFRPPRAPRRRDFLKPLNFSFLFCLLDGLFSSLLF